MLSPPALALLVALSASQELASAELAFDAGRFDDVLAAVDRALNEPLPRAERLRAWHLKAMTHAAFDDRAATIDAFRRALGVDPAYVPGDEAGPKILSLFAEAKRQGAILFLVPAAEPPPPPQEDAPPSSFYQRGWFWGLVAGIVVAGAGATATVLLWPRPPAGNLGTAKLP